MVEHSFRLDKALIFLFVAIIIASPFIFVILGVSLFEAIVFVVAAGVISAVCYSSVINDLYRMLLNIVSYKRLDGKYGGSGKWRFSSIPGDLAMICIAGFSVKIAFSSSFGVFYV